jgi:hypothetical protein
MAGSPVWLHEALVATGVPVGTQGSAFAGAGATVTPIEGRREVRSVRATRSGVFGLPSSERDSSRITTIHQ